MTGDQQKKFHHPCEEEKCKQKMKGGGRVQAVMIVVTYRWGIISKQGRGKGQSKSHVTRKGNEYNVIWSLTSS